MRGGVKIAAARKSGRWGGDGWRRVEKGGRWWW